MAELHELAGVAEIALLAILTVIAVVAAATTRPPSWFGVAWLVGVAGAVLQIVMGLVLLGTGAMPRDPTHFLYGVVLTSVLVAAPILTASSRDVVRLRLLAACVAVAAAVAVRLLNTG